MFKTVTAKVASTRNFVSRHRVAIAVATTTVVCYKAHLNVTEGFRLFLKEHNLLDEYYTETPVVTK